MIRVILDVCHSVTVVARPIPPINAAIMKPITKAFHFGQVDGLQKDEEYPLDWLISSS
jgi:hypothetical protein